MRWQCFDENEWLFPDTPIDRPENAMALDAPRGGSVCFQILTDAELAERTPVDVAWINAAPVGTTAYQLLACRADRNSGKDLLCAADYREVSDFVTREAPFDVYDATLALDGCALRPGRAAFCLRFDVPLTMAAGSRDMELRLAFAGREMRVPIRLRVRRARVPARANGRFGMVNWLKLEEMERQHGLTRNTPEWRAVCERYLINQIDMRNTHLMLPAGEPVRSETGRVIGFDFSLAETLGDMALGAGFRYVMGGFVARFHDWRESDLFLLWDKDIEISCHEGYRQLKLYFSGLRASIEKRGWQGRYMQCLVDEPQLNSSERYRVLTSICRRFLPGTPIHDPVESPRLDGAPDIWCVKQAIFETYIDEYRALQAQGEEMWLYTCGFPAGKWMNRVMDLPLLVSRLPMWMCALYGATGFLHWGYNVHTSRPFEITSYRPNPENDACAYPPGNAHIVYPDTEAGGPMNSMRAHLQREGAEDYELLARLIESDAEGARALIRRVCVSFSEYDASAERFARVREALLDALDALDEDA